VRKPFKQRSLRRVVICGFVVALAVGVSASGTRHRGASDQTARAGQAGMRVYVDPQTGQLREPTPEEAAALSAAIQADESLRTLAGPQQITGVGGAIGYRLDESFSSYSVATVKPDGSVSFECVTGDKAAKAAVSTGITVAGKEHVNDR
jgi:hypothetical protein